MAYMKYESAWKLLNVYKFDFKHEINDECLCVICNKILKNALQGPCGCRYCMECIHQHLNSKEQYCPGVTDDCKELKIAFESDLQIDYVINKKISMIEVNCPVESCKFACPLRSMEEHIKSHEKKCPYVAIGCDRLSTDVTSITNHLNTDVYHHTTLLLDCVGELKKEITQLKESLKRAEKDSQQKQNLLIALEQKIREMELSQRSDSTFNPEMKLKMDQKDTEKLFEESNHMTKVYLEKDRTSIQNESGTGIRGTNDAGVNHNRTETLMHLGPFLSTSTYFWTIKHFDKIYKLAKNSDQFFVESEPRYSHYEGYKMCLTLYPNGTGVGRDTHLSVLVHIMPGEHDHKLTWPMKQTSRISLVDQTYGNIHFDKRFNYHSADYDSRSEYCKPSRSMNRGFGDMRLVKLNDLFANNRLYQNDSICIRFSMTK